jgi:hypothetical protein
MGVKAYGKAGKANWKEGSQPKRDRGGWLGNTIDIKLYNCIAFWIFEQPLPASLDREPDLKPTSTDPLSMSVPTISLDGMF